MATKISVEITKRDHDNQGVRNGTFVYHAMLTGPADEFRGCPCGRGTTEAGALLDLVRPGYSLPYGTKITVADLEVTVRKDYTAAAFAALAAKVVR